MLLSEIVNLSTSLEAQARPHKTQVQSTCEFHEALHTGLQIPLIPTLWCQTDRYSL